MSDEAGRHLGPGTRVLRAVLALPDLLPVALLALGVSALLAVIVGQLRPAVVLPFAAALFFAVSRALPAPVPATRAQAGALGVTLALCACWWATGTRYAGEYVVVNRDPGFLTLQALWLMDHPSAVIPVGSAGAAAAAVPGASAGTEAFWLGDGHLLAQGNKMLPALLAVLGWGGGETAVLRGGLVVGVVALLAVFAAARRFVGPGWALVPTAALSLSLPFLVATRAAYTEPLVIVFLAGGLALGHAAWAARAGPGRHALVGALLGAVGTARIDGAVAVAGLAAAYGVVAAATLDREGRLSAVRATWAATGTACAMLALGMVDVARLSPAYLAEHASLLTGLLAATACVVLAAATLPMLPDRTLRRLRHALLEHRRVLGVAAAAAVLAGGVALATRPLWWEARLIDASSGAGYSVQVLQSAAGQPLDGSRSYDEQTLTWVVWYLGVPAVVLGVAGLAFLAHRAVARRDPTSALLVAVVGVAAALPLIRASITPDQIWAVRRLLPAAFPGLLMTAACALAALATGPSRRWPAARPVVAAVLALSVVAFPVTTWRPGASVVELSGRATQAHAVCDALDDLGVERVVWTHSSPFRYLATLRVVCDVEVVEVLEPPSTTDLAAIRRAWGDEPVAALSFDVTDYPWTAVPSTSVGGTASTTLGRTLVGVPRTVDTTWSEVWVGLVEPDGSVSPAVVQPAG